MTQIQVDLRKEQEQLLELEVAPLTYFMKKEQRKNPLTTVVKDLKKELDQNSSIEDNVVHTQKQNVIAEKDIKPKKVYSSRKVKAQFFFNKSFVQMG